MDVTEQVIKIHQTYGGSGNGNPAYYSSNKSLNYAKTSNSLLNAKQENLTVIPYEINYKDTVGLQGAENIFVKLQLNIQNSLSLVNGIEIDDWIDATIYTGADDSDIFYESAVTDYARDLETVNTYDPALITNEGLNFVPNAHVLVNLENLKTGNKYIDAWFDATLYTPDRRPWEYDKIIVPIKSFIYVGFHARNTKRLPYNVSLTVANELINPNDLTSEQRRYLINA
tara:strand:- start:63 stop:746 length:684 start_codon:yes stop_codon:yes gene_type:complete